MFLTRNYTYSTTLRTYIHGEEQTLTRGRADSTQADRIEEGIATSL